MAAPRTFSTRMSGTWILEILVAVGAVQGVCICRDGAWRAARALQSTRESGALERAEDDEVKQQHWQAHEVDRRGR